MIAAAPAARLDGPLGFVGGGRMATAIVRRLLAARAADPAQITVCEVAADRRDELAGRFGVRTTGDAAGAVASAATVVLAVKPQHAAEALASLHGRLPDGALLLSIVAGARIAWLARAAGHDAVVRAMPNIPVEVGLGATVWCAAPAVTARQRGQARAVLGAVGLEIEARREVDIEIATGLTGPTPAFVFLIIESLVEAGVALGFPRDRALELVLQSVEGSVAMLRQPGAHAAVLRGDVTSPGGATAAGLYVLERAGLRASFIDATRAVHARGLELGAMLDREADDLAGGAVTSPRDRRDR